MKSVLLAAAVLLLAACTDSPTEPLPDWEYGPIRGWIHCFDEDSNGVDAVLAVWDGYTPTILRCEGGLTDTVTLMLAGAETVHIDAEAGGFEDISTDSPLYPLIWGDEPVVAATVRFQGTR